MNRAVMFLAAGFALAIAGPASAADATFVCGARTPDTCNIRIFHHPRGGRVIVLAAGTRQTVPGLTASRDTYCVATNKAPTSRCARRPVVAGDNS